jgi:hypothetical protein
MGPLCRSDALSPNAPSPNARTPGEGLAWPEARRRRGYGRKRKAALRMGWQRCGAMIGEFWGIKLFSHPFLVTVQCDELQT